MQATIHIDGAARGNPGPASFAYIIQTENGAEYEAKGCLGNQTNNVAEYTALVRALEQGRRLGLKHLLIRSDSALLVNQMMGTYKVKNPGLRVLYDRARELAAAFEQVRFQHVPREQNARADRLCNQALDGGTDGSECNEVSASEPTAAPEPIRTQALACLRAAAAVWAQGDVDARRVEDVWDELWGIVQMQAPLLPGS